MKKQTRFSHVWSAVLCMVLVAAMALSLMACTNNNDPASTPNSSTEAPADATPLGEGATAFTLEVTDKEGKVTTFAINTDKTTVGDALLELDLIAGEEGAYGLYIKTVNGITADYDTDGTYWAFYINGAYASSGVDSTTIEAGAVYALKVEK